MLLRKTDIGEIDRVMEILADGRASLAALGIDQWQGGYPHKDMIERDIVLGESYVVEADDGSLIATAMISFRGEKDYLIIEDGSWLTESSFDTPSYAVVHRVAVAASRKGSGAASFILCGAEDLAFRQNMKSVRIDTHADNAPMRGLLVKEGYVQCGTIYIAHAEESNPARIAYEKLIAQSDEFVKTA